MNEFILITGTAKEFEQQLNKKTNEGYAILGNHVMFMKDDEIHYSALMNIWKQ